jgi:ferritin-like protein
MSLLSPQTLDMHRALTSLQEELEAVDWYQQRIDAASDADLKRILAHNRDEEKEHAAMVLEWIRRRDPAFDRVLRQYLFTAGSLLEIESEAEASGQDESPDRQSTLGSLKGEL